MLKVGLTGGIAAGKTTVGEMLRIHGAHVLKADDLAHQLMQPGQAVYDRVIATFGEQILNPDRTIHRRRLADAVFPTGRIAELNAIVHPAVIAAQDEWMDNIIRHDATAIVVIEAALLLEAGTWKRYDCLITVTCPLEQKIERFAARHAMSHEQARAEVERRMKAQASDDEKIKVSQFVIDNSGSRAETQEQVDRIWPELKKLSASGSGVPGSRTPGSRS
jgi:dephospho-CoA kinase